MNTRNQNEGNSIDFGWWLPHGLFVDHRGHVWLTDVGLHQVFEYDRDGRVHVADRQNDRIQVFSADGRLLALWAERAMGRPYGLRAGPDGLLYVTDGGEQPKSFVPP